jgi:IS5 family transposase
MRPKERRDSGQKDLFRARLDQIVDVGHPLAKLAGSVDWRFLEARFGAAYTDKPGHPPLPTRLMAGLAILKHMHDLSDEALCERWVENPLYQGVVVNDLLLSGAIGFGLEPRLELREQRKAR